MRPTCANFVGWLTQRKNCNLAIFSPIGVLLEGALERTAQLLLKRVSIDDIRCVANPVQVKEGWGGAKIDQFPPYNFFALFHSGREDEAIKGMQSWYYQRMLVHGHIFIPKAEGGMAGGSMHRDIDAQHEVNGISLAKDFGNVNYDLVSQVIEKKVNYRFETFRSVRDHGQKFSWDFVRLIPGGGTYHLRGGHHRVAALAVCGHQEVTATVLEPIFLKTIRKIATEFLV